MTFTSRLSLVLILFSLVSLSLQDGLTQVFCSSQNTGTSNHADQTIYESLGNCMTKCKDKFAYGVVLGEDCWCSNYAPADQQSVSLCSDKCLGYPFEDCGNAGSKLYGYIALGITPSGTQGSPSSTSFFELATMEAPPPLPPPPVVVAAPNTPTKSSDSPKMGLTLPGQTSNSPAVSSTKVPKTTSEVIDVTVTREEDPPQTTPTLASSITTPVTTQQTKTISGSTVLWTVTLTPTSSPSASSSPGVQPAKKMSSGTVVAIAVAVVVVCIVLFAALIIGFCCWRRKRTPSPRDLDSDGIPQRNPSILSRAGLLGAAGGYGSSSSGGGQLGNTGSQMERRNSTPLIIDQRLNPTAFMQHDDTSRTSFVSVQDNRDYTRTLNVRNPDPIERRPVPD
ncbi:hypothetical protein BT63DRAFT_450468 [Microthyrium microscopicum]|uniref:WSC domain-containing protein n=1 Tax=Microthyrium microscopicum TaxID=703497 RepID=A0A6A6UVL6_9PEZI|nr:hypothetical protein BT63DRAFT_450468 [Microthyrium microscopicum]